MSPCHEFIECFDYFIICFCAVLSIQGLAEKMNWLKKTSHDEAFGSALLKGGISDETIKQWCVDCQVVTETSDTGPVYGGIFDTLEDTDVEDCLEKCIKFNDNAKNASVATE